MYIPQVMNKYYVKIQCKCSLVPELNYHIYFKQTFISYDLSTPSFTFLTTSLHNFEIFNPQIISWLKEVANRVTTLNKANV